MNVFVALKRYISIQISIVTRDNTADALDFYVENARSTTYPNSYMIIILAGWKRSQNELVRMIRVNTIGVFL